MFKTVNLLLSLFCIFSTGTVQATASSKNKITIKTSVGKAYNKKGALLYTEKHTEKYAPTGAILSLSTEYFNLENKQFAKLDSDFQKHLYVPDYTYSDSRMKRQDGIKSGVKKNEVIAFAKANEKTDLKEKTFTVTDDLVSGQGLYSYVYTNFDKLLDMKNTISIKFLIPMQQAKYGFYIEQYLKDENKVVYRIKFSSWLIRMFAPFIQVTYDTKTKKLIEFKGPSNVPGTKGEIQNVTIKYE